VSLKVDIGTCSRGFVDLSQEWLVVESYCAIETMVRWNL
jgi:hypothetical protein